MGFSPFRWLGTEAGLTGTAVGIRIVAEEVKFLDRDTTNDRESIYQGCFH